MTRTKLPIELAEKEFEHELEVFRTEANAATQFFYSWLAIHATMSEHTKVLHHLNESSLFWATVLGGLQQSTFIVLGRIFDQDTRSKHNLDRLLRLGGHHRGIFGKQALGRRKERLSPNAFEWLPAYLQGKYEPSADDFRRLRSHVNKWRQVYERVYRPVRNQLFAHKSTSDPELAAALFAKTNIREMQRLLMFLRQLYDCLWELLNNGAKPILRPQRYSVNNMRLRPSPAGSDGSLQERITKEAEQFLLAAAGVSAAKATREKVAR